MSVVSLTLHDGRAVGIPAGAALIIVDFAKAPPEESPKGKTLIRYTLGAGARSAFVRDAYKAVLGRFPLPCGGSGWAHLTDTEGRDLVVAQGCAAAYEQLESGAGFAVTFMIPTGPVELAIKGELADIQALAPPAAAEIAPA